jgi:hypothetical protein
VNNQETPVSGSLRFYSSDGKDFTMTIDGVTAAEFPFVVNGRSSTVLETDGVSDPLFSGWAEAFLEGEVDGTLQYSLETLAGKPVAEAGISSSPPARRLTAAVSRDLSVGTDTGIAIVNPSSSQKIEVSVVVRDQNDEVLITVDAMMEPRQHSAGFLSQLGNLPDKFSGTLLIDASAGVSATLTRTVDGVTSASSPFAQ